MSLSSEYLEFYGKVQDVLLGSNDLQAAIQQLKQLTEQYEQ